MWTQRWNKDTRWRRRASLVSILSSAVVSALCATLVVWLLRTWISERLKGAITHEYAEKLENYRAQLLAQNQISVARLQAEFEKEAAIRSAAQSASSEGQRAAIERRLSAIDRIWRAVLALRNKSPQFMTFLDVLSVEEYKNLTVDRRLREFGGDFSPQRIESMIPDPATEEARPYVGEHMWSLFSVYQAVTFRVLVLMHLANTQPNKPTTWFEDPGIRQLLTAALSHGELQQFESAEVGKVTLFRRLMELKIIQSASRVISGQEFGAEAVQQAQEILAATSLLTTNVERAKIGLD